MIADILIGLEIDTSFSSVLNIYIHIDTSKWTETGGGMAYNNSLKWVLWGQKTDG